MVPEVKCPYCQTMQALKLESVDSGFAMFMCTNSDCEEYFTDLDTYVYVDEGLGLFNTQEFLVKKGLCRVNPKTRVLEEVPQDER